MLSCAGSKTLKKTKTNTQAAFDQQPQSSKNSKPFNKPYNKQFNTQQKSDRSKITPMDVDPSLRSKQGKLFNHNSEPLEENPESDENEQSDSESECEANFQVDSLTQPPR